jgi:hypothetical protein
MPRPWLRFTAELGGARAPPRERHYAASTMYVRPSRRDLLVHPAKQGSPGGARMVHRLWHEQILHPMAPGQGHVE